MKKKLFVNAAALVCACIMALGMFVGCSDTPCAHEYVDGVCGKCDAVCPHESYVDGICSECKIVCAHEAYENGVCTECGTVCEHIEYENGVCAECGTVCLHEEYISGVCTECGTACLHERYENGVCTECGAEEYKDPEPPENNYNYTPHLSAKLPRIDITSATLMDDATRYVPSYDNTNPDNNIDWQYHDSTVTVSECDDGYALSDVIAGVKIRGNWTTTYPKKPFRIKFDKKQGMLGLNDGAKCKSWVLLADYKDFTLERNSLAFYLGNQIFGSDGYYCSDFRQVELYLNNQYWGVYLLAEQQQVNKNRIAVTEPDDIADGYQGTDIGYFIEYDGYYNLETESERFSCNYNYSDPNAGYSSPIVLRNGNTVNPNQFGFAIKNDVYFNEGDESNCAQKLFIQNYMWHLYKLCYEAVYHHVYYQFNEDRTALIPYVPVTASPVQETVLKVIDVQSLVDMYIMNEIACDYDIEWSSFHMNVDFGANAKNNLLRFEAPWDFDSAFGLRDACANATGLYAANKNNPWLTIFINEDWFWNKVKDKWQGMNAAGVQTSALVFLRTLESNYAEVYYNEGNFDKWGFQINGEATWEIQQNVHNHADGVNHLYGWLSTRFEYLDSQWNA